MFDTATFTSIQNNAGLPAWNVLLEPSGFINLALPYIFGIAGIILLLNIITSGFKMMTSTGDPKVMQAAQAKLTTSVIGISILFVSFWIVMLIMKFLGIETILFN
ncbi:MAG: hypothetical protein AAB625_00410 [Patescibacteria group bacterium]